MKLSKYLSWIVTICLILSWAASAQGYAEYFSKQLYASSGKAPMLPSDTLDLGGGKYLFLQISPLAHFEGYDTPPLQEEIVVHPYAGARERPYSCRWGLTSEGVIYLQDINYRSTFTSEVTAQDKEQLLRWAMALVGQRQSPLRADWLSGSLRAYRHQQSNYPYREQNKNQAHRSQKAQDTRTYLLSLKRGQVYAIGELKEEYRELKLNELSQEL